MSFPRSGYASRVVAEHRPGAGRVVAGRYRLCDMVGRGAMGTVWLASDDVLCRQVAVKEITYPPYLTDDERRQLRERTLREARAAARFAHPKVTTVHDVVEEDGKPYIVMEHIRSRNLIELVRAQGPLPPVKVARIGLDVLSALEAAHQAGIVHRDVKPANVLVNDDGQAWLTDFGIAMASGDATLTTEGMLLGSPSYMSPERARGLEPGPAADLWSLGATLYTAVEGRPPFERGDAVPTLVAVLSDDPDPYRAAGPLEPVLRGLLVKEPAQRLTVAEVRVRLEQVVSGAAVPTAPDEVSRAAPDLASAERGNVVARVALGELSAMASSATDASRQLKAAAKEAARTAASRPGSARRRSRSGDPDQRHQPAEAAGGAGPAERAGATGPAERAQPAERVRGATTGAGRRTPSSSTTSTAERPRWRFKRRWVAIPLAVVFLIFVLVVGAVGWLAWLILSYL